eukprot:1944837-Prymnesium_polylepis.2
MAHMAMSMRASTTKPLRVLERRRACISSLTIVASLLGTRPCCSSTPTSIETTCGASQLVGLEGFFAPSCGSASSAERSTPSSSAGASASLEARGRDIESVSRGRIT